LDEFTYYAEGNPLVEDATVELSNSIVKRTLLTDKNGVAYFQGLKEGTYQMIIKKKNHGTFKGLVVVEGQNMTISAFIPR
jgi:uncharacterized surface anchored protein